MSSCDVHGGSSLLSNGHDSNGPVYDVTQNRCYQGHSSDGQFGDIIEEPL
jgi:hypothetical protein